MAIGLSGSSLFEHDIENFDDVLDLVKSTSSYNVWYLVLLSTASIIAPSEVMSSVFLILTPPYWCKVEELVAANWSAEQIRNFSSSKSDSCQYLDYNYTIAVEVGYEAAMKDSSLVPLSNETKKCPHRFFEEETNSVVTEWDLVCDEAPLASTAIAACMFGHLLGSAILGYIVDRFGRKFGLRYFTIGGIVMGACVSTASNIYYFAAFRIASCAFFIGCFISSYVQAIESSEPRHRPFVNTMVAIPWGMGHILSAVLGYYIYRWRMLQLSMVFSASVLIFASCLVPESPRWLCRHGKHEDCLKVLKVLAKNSRSKMPPDYQMLTILRTIHAKSERSTNLSLSKWMDRWIKPQIIWRTPIVFHLWFVSSLLYYGVALGASSFGADVYTFVFCGGVLEILAYISIWPGIHFIGRVKFTVLICVLAGLGFLVIMMLQIYSMDGTSVIGMSYFCKFFITIMFQMSYLLTGELYPTDIRCFVMGECSAVARVASVLAPYVPIMIHNQWMQTGLYGSLAVSAGILAALLPETKDLAFDHTPLDEEMTMLPKTSGMGYGASGAESSQCDSDESTQILYSRRYSVEEDDPVK